MGRCVRIRGGSKPPPPATEAAASCLTLRSGRRVPPPAVCRCSPRTSGRPPPRRHRGWCGAEAAADKQLEPACGGRPGRRGSAAADDVGSPARRGRVLGAQRRLCDDDGRQVVEEAVPPARPADTGADAAVARGVVVDDGRGDSFHRRPKTPPPMTDDDCDAAAVKLKVKHENESRYRGSSIAGQRPSPLPPPPPTEAELEAFFAAAELAERRRFAEAYNYDVALDRPLEGRFEWAPVRT